MAEHLATPVEEREPESAVGVNHQVVDRHLFDVNLLVEGSHHARVGDDDEVVRLGALEPFVDARFLLVGQHHTHVSLTEKVMALEFFTGKPKWQHRLVEALAGATGDDAWLARYAGLNRGEKLRVLAEDVVTLLRMESNEYSLSSDGFVGHD